jgi:hypothetical protein
MLEDGSVESGKFLKWEVGKKEGRWEVGKVRRWERLATAIMMAG